MSWIWWRSWALSDSNSTTGGSWATSLRTWPGCAVTRASPASGPAPPRCGGAPPAHGAGVRGDRGDPADGPAAAAEDVRRLAAEGRQQAVHVVGLLLGRDILRSEERRVGKELKSINSP